MLIGLGAARFALPVIPLFKRLVALMKSSLSLAFGGSVCAALAFGLPSFGQEDETVDRIGVVVTGWGAPVSPVLSRSGERLQQSVVGEKTNAPDELCTQWHIGAYPYQSDKGLLPFGVAFKTEGYEEMWDSSGIYRLTENATTYVALIDETIRLSVEDVQNKTITPLKDLAPAKGSSVLTSGFSPDPRDGTDHLAGLYFIDEANGLHDFIETGAVWSIRSASMLGELPEAPARPKQMTLDIENYLTAYMSDLFGDGVDFRFGYYGAMNDESKPLDQTIVALSNEGIEKIVVARDTADQNLYANNFMELYPSLKALCKAGYGTDDIALTQVRQVGRTPEYNTLIINNLERHFEIIPEGANVSIIYVTHGQPWPGSNPDNGAMSAPAPRIKEVFHENAFLNYQSFKHYALAAFDEGSDGLYKLNFSKSGGSGEPDSRANSLYAYAMQSSRQIGSADDPLRYTTIRENLSKAIVDDGQSEIILALSHWADNGTGITLSARTNNELPLNSKEEIKAGVHSIIWCEDHSAPGQFSQMRAAGGECPDGYARIQLTQAFQEFADDFSNGYAQRIRGGVERYGVFPDLDMTILAEAPISKLDGGTVAIIEGDLARARLEVRPDPRPNAPEEFEWQNAYRPETDENPNTGPDAIRAINDYASIDDYLDSAKDDFTAYIGTQEKVRANRKMPMLDNAVSPVVYVGPYRTLFNAPATVTLPYDPKLVEDQSKIVALIYNDLTRGFDPVYPVSGAEDIRINEAAGTASFDVQVLGNFVLAEAE